MEKEMPEVHVGQVWIDNDPRGTGRRLRVEEVGIFKKGEEYVLLRSLSARESARAPGPACVKVLRRRMRPTRSGYRLAEAGASG